MPRKQASATTGRVYVDGSGGALAALAAGVARVLGDAGARAATSAKAVNVPPEVAAVLGEIGGAAPAVELGAPKIDAPARVDVGAWDVRLFDGDGELERLALARIARDRIVKKLEAAS